MQCMVCTSSQVILQADHYFKSFSIFLRKDWVLIIFLYVSESRKMPVLSRNFGLGACDIIMMLSESQKLGFWLRAQSKVMETIVNDNFSGGLLKQHFQSKLIAV